MEVVNQLGLVKLATKVEFKALLGCRAWDQIPWPVFLTRSSWKIHQRPVVKKEKIMEVVVEETVAARRSANFHPSIWGEFFLAYASQEMSLEEEGEPQQLEEEVRKMLTETPDELPGKLDLIDAIQRLGVSYHFESEIEASLQKIFDAYHELSHKDGNDLYTAALRFRLLRQQGFHASCDVFNKFKNPEGDFKESLASNVRGMLSLYEAANFGVHGEKVLDEALKFTSNNLESMVPNLSNFLAAQVVQALEMPIHKTLTRMGARRYIPLYQQDESHDKLLLKFAKLDFNKLQRLHQKELSGLTKWWKGLDFATKLPFARDRLVECYFWILGVYFEPKYCLARMMLTKVLCMISIIDDIYDVYATLDELIVFTEAIERWHINELDRLPSYMRHCYRALLDIYEEFEEKLAREGKSERVNYGKLEMKKLVKGYFQEAVWFHNGYVPKVDEYMKVALVTTGYMAIAVNSMLGMGDSVTTQTFDWVTNEPLLVRAASVPCRLVDDMNTHEFEQERGHVASAVECYVNEYGVTKQEAVDELNKQAANAWKDINGECLNSNAEVPVAVLERLVNLPKSLKLIYKDGDGYTFSATKAKDVITTVLVDPIPI